MADTDLEGSALLLLGEIRGQLRELIHTSNNTSQKVDALGVRVAALEASEHERRGARDVITTIVKSPAVAWLAAAVAGVWAFISGKVHI